LIPEPGVVEKIMLTYATSESRHIRLLFYYLQRHYKIKMRKCCFGQCFFSPRQILTGLENLFPKAFYFLKLSRKCDSEDNYPWVTSNNSDHSDHSDYLQFLKCYCYGSTIVT
jgi:hypothetical protein